MALRAASVYKVAARLPASRASKQQGRLFSTPSSGTGPSMRNPSGTSRRTEVAKRQASAFAAQLPPLPELSAIPAVAKYIAGGAAVASIYDALRGEARDFYDYRFITEKDPDDVGGESSLHPRHPRKALRRARLAPLSESSSLAPSCCAKRSSSYVPVFHSHDSRLHFAFCPWFCSWILRP
jgi:hypothetical protein